MEKAFKEFLKTLKTNESAISQALGALVVVIVGVLLFNYFKSNRPEPEITQQAEQTTVTSGENNVELTTNEEGKFVPKNLPAQHTVQAGEDLWKISEKYYGNGYNWVDIAQENQIANANVVSEGTQLTIPQAALRWDRDVKKPEASPTTAMSSPEPTASASPASDAPAGSKGGQSMLEATEYTVQRGDHLWKIALQAYGDGYKWVDIHNANKEKIANPNYIEIGMTLILPR